MRVLQYTNRMDELEISGKRYISSRRAAKEHKYHSDYIGQLIRAKKVVGTKVGRAWYVEIESLAAYFNKELQSKSEQEVAQNTATYVVSEKKEILKPIVRHISPVSTYETMENEFEEKNKSAIQTRTTNLQYVPKSEPLFPAIQKTQHTTVMHKTYTPIEQPRSKTIQRPTTTRRPWATVLMLLLLGGISFGVAGFLSSRLVSTTTIVNGEVASVGISFQ